jgi:hypothetical protein
MSMLSAIAKICASSSSTDRRRTYRAKTLQQKQRRPKPTPLAAPSCATTELAGVGWPGGRDGQDTIGPPSTKVSVSETDFRDAYCKRPNFAQLKVRRRTDTDDHELLAQAWQAANAKARELGWIV